MSIMPNFVIWCLTFSVGVISLLGDYILSVITKDAVRAITDSISHGSIGLISWLITAMLQRLVTRSSIQVVLFESVCCGLIACVIDVDHFFAAKSLNLKAAMQLGQSRPLLHCTTLPVCLLVICMATSHLCNAPRLCRCGWLIWMAFFSHHVRDANRRGLWLWPLGSTPPLSRSVYVLVLLSLPYATYYLLCSTCPTEVRPHTNYSIV